MKPQKSALIILLLVCALVPAIAQQTDTIPKRNSVYISLSPMAFRVQETESYFLPNDQFKAGITSAFHYERLFGNLQNKKLHGFRLGVEGIQRNGRYEFNRDRLVRREFLLNLPVELLFRERLRGGWQLAGSLGAQHTWLAQRSTFSLIASTGQTMQEKNNWLNSIFGLTGSVGAVHHGVRDQQFGFRISRDVGSFNRQAASVRETFLRYETYGLYYSLAVFRN